MSSSPKRIFADKKGDRVVHDRKGEKGRESLLYRRAPPYVRECVRVYTTTGLV